MDVRQKWNARWLAVVLAAILVLAIGLVVVLWAFGLVSEGSFGREVAKGLLQLIAVVVVAGGVSVFVQRYLTERDRRWSTWQRRDEELRSMLDETVAAYHATKLARRLIRALLWDDAAGNTVELTTYDDQMFSLNSAQLDFEALSLATQVLKDPRVDERSLTADFETIEKSLNRVVKEYESKRRHVAYGKGTIGTLPNLADFIAKARAGCFKNDIANPTEHAIEMLRSALRMPATSKPVNRL